MGGASLAENAHLEYMKRAVDLVTRQAGSIEVALIYDRLDRSLAVFVHDALTGEELLLPVSGDEASEVYRHPYAYAHRAVRYEPELEKAV